jgi:uncharacterized RDD family membrane protein YckC
MSETQASARSTGYLSEDSKKKFTLVAGVLGALFFVLQFVVPMVAMFALMPAMMFGNSFTSYSLQGSASYRGQVHVVEESQRLGDMQNKSSRTRLVRIGPNDIEEVAPLEGWEPRLLADGERLWLVSSERMATMDGQQVRPLQVPQALGDISRPFLLDGAPAVVESRPNGERLMTWRDGAWKSVRGLSDVGGACCIQLLATDGRLLVFRETGQSVFARDLNREESEWAVVVSKARHWYAFERDGNPAVASSGSEGFQIVQLDGQRWTPVASASTGASFAEEVAAFQLRPGGPIALVSSGFPGSLKVHTWDGTRFVDEKKIGSFSPFPRGMMLIMWLPHLGSMLLSLVLAVILSSLMRVHRVTVYVHEGTEVLHASLTRRALSQFVDALIMSGPGVVLFYRMFGDFERMFSGPLGPFSFFGMMAGSFAWVFAMLLAFSLTEGLWGVTPGKWVTGIRVIGTDLAPCGFGRALIRNILKLVDGFFNFLVGILMVAYTPDWQRLGDLAARTIVIRRPRGHLQALRPATPN